MKRGIMAESIDNKHSVLIVDDQEMNREILKNMLHDEFGCIEAENGRDALHILQERHSEIAAVLLDIVMPVMDGYAVLEALRQENIQDIPIIVMTSNTGVEEEIKALAMGAWDFVSKPYQPTILSSRLKNAIARSQIGMFEKMRYQAEHDQLTGLYNRRKFFTETRKMLDANPDTEYVLIRTDVDQFSLLNSFWGEKVGDEFLIRIARGIEQQIKQFETATYGRINADNFCACVPYEKEKIDKELEKARKAIISFKQDYFIKPTFGIYIITERSMPIQGMYERVAMAAKTCKGKYNTYVGYYDKDMRNAASREQEIINEMQNALDSGQFVPFIQTQYDLKTNRPYGGEALVRWMHPQKGMISPREFIPVFERNGFIGKLDYYMWESVCRCLRRWTDEGYQPAPISVNISRANMYNPNIVSIIDGLVKKYNISPKLLNLELTESAYMDNPDAMREIVKSLQEKGFLVLMDDFGSGYSSLNTLKDIAVDVLKIDMKFLSGNDENERSERILSSIIRMAGWLSIPVIVEGVETAHQVDFLRSIGCGYIQGYFFARPMPVKDYEALAVHGDEGIKEHNLSADRVTLGRTIWSSDPSLEFLFNHVHQPLAVYEYDHAECYPIRVNVAFNEFFGYGINTVFFDEKADKNTDAETNKRIHEGICTLGEEHPYFSTESVFHDREGNLCRIVLVINYMGNVENRKVIMVSFDILTR